VTSPSRQCGAAERETFRPPTHRRGAECRLVAGIREGVFAKALSLLDDEVIRSA
jgi:hypothetical protein